MSDEELDQLALGVHMTLESASSATLGAFAAGLRLAGEPIALFAGPIADLACDVERGQQVSNLTRIAMRVALKRAALEGSLIARLSDAELVGGAVAAIAEEMLA